MAVLVPAATVVVCFVQTPGDPVMLDGPDPPAAFELEPTRLKGVEPSLFVYRLAEGGNQAGERVPAQALVHEGELVQLAYLSGEFTHGTVLSIDGRGHVTVHHPDESGDTRLGAGPTALDHAFELDDAPEFERFVFVVGHEPLDTKKIVRAAEVVASLGPVARVIPLPLEPTLRQVSVVVRKPAKPP
jgi:hypothetical protein